jgi:hypothetical protein
VKWMIMYIFSILSTGIVMQCMFFVSLPKCIQSTWLSIYTVLFINFINYQKRCTRLTAQMIKFTSCLPMVCGSVQLLGLPPTLKLVRFLDCCLLLAFNQYN